jgi:hypothetical protein
MGCSPWVIPNLGSEQLSAYTSSIQGRTLRQGSWMGNPPASSIRQRGRSINRSVVLLLKGLGHGPGRVDCAAGSAYE